MFGPHFPAAASTPFVLGLAEVACHAAVAANLEDGQVTVGIRAVVDHFAPTPVGSMITVNAVLVGQEGRRLSFTVELNDSSGPCARVEHERAIVAKSAIETKLASRAVN